MAFDSFMTCFLFMDQVHPILMTGLYSAFQFEFIFPAIFDSLIVTAMAASARFSPLAHEIVIGGVRFLFKLLLENQRLLCIGQPQHALHTIAWLLRQHNFGRH